MVPSPDQIKKRTSASKFADTVGTGYQQSSEVSNPAEEDLTSAGEIPAEEESLEIALEPEIENFAEIEEEEDRDLGQSIHVRIEENSEVRIRNVGYYEGILGLSLIHI